MALGPLFDAFGDVLKLGTALGSLLAALLWLFRSRLPGMKSESESESSEDRTSSALG